MSHRHEGRGVKLEEFQKIKNERIIELRSHTEARRQHDLQRIRDMKSNNGIHPLDLFPKEVWEYIFEFLTPNDLGSISEVHDLFQEQLSKRRIYDILLPQVLNLKSPKDESHYNADKCYTWMEEMPLEELFTQELIPLRKVSKSMRNNIDRLFETVILNNLFSKNERDVETLTLCLSGQIVERLKVDAILENFSVGSNKATRFFLRSLEVNLHGYGIPNGKMLEAFIQFKSKVSSFLEIVGEQIWRFKYAISSLEGTNDELSSQIYVALMEWAELMPNLKWLVLDDQYETRDMQKFSTFPHLDKLVRICWGFDHTDYNHAFPMFSAILKANPHVKVLKLTAEMIEEGETEAFFENHLKLLFASTPSLALDACFINSDRLEFENECKFDSIQPAINPNWHLKSLHLGCDLFSSKLRSVFELVQNFQTLQQLVLGKLVAPRFDGNIPLLNLPNLTHLKLEVNYYDHELSYEKHVMELTPATNFFFSLQFLLFAKKLKKLVWKLQGWRTQNLKLRRFLVNRECNVQCVNFRAGMRDLRSSNLWDVFPCLKKVKTEIRNEKAHEDRYEYDENEYHRSEKF